MVHGTVVQESPQRRGRNPTIQTLGDKSWDSTEEVLGQCSLGTVLEQCSLGTVQSWDGAVMGQSWTRAVLVRSWDSAVLGQWGLKTVHSWDGAVLGHWSWDSDPGTVVLGH